MDDWFYDELRNKEQCGYYVAVSRRHTRGVDGFLFTIESAKYDPLELQSRIETFIQKAFEKLSQGPEVIMKFYEGLVARKKEGFKDIKEEAGYFFGQLKEFKLEQTS